MARAGDGASPEDGTPVSPTQIVGGRRFLVSFFVASAGMYAVFQGMQQIVLPTQIADIDPSGKVLSYGALASVGALTAAIGNPLFGALSDRTRSRWGKRVPWLVGSASVALVLLALLGMMSSLFWLGAAYLMVMLTMSAYQAVVSALIPDRVPASRRGIAASVGSAALTIGVVYGINVTPVFVETPSLAYLAVGGLLVVGAVLVAVLTRDPTAEAPSRAPSPPRGPGAASLLSVLRDRDYLWAFVARITFMVGHWTISTYQLYTLTDYIGVANLPSGDPASAVAVIGTLKLGIAFVTALVAGPLSDRLERRKIFVVIGALGVAAGIALPLMWPTWAGMVAYAVVVGFFYGIFLAVDHALMTLVLPRQADAARDLGLLQVATTGPQIAGPFIAALVITLGGGYAPLFAFAAVMAALSAVLILPIRGVR